MAVFFELTTDVFRERFDRVEGGPRATRAGAASVRRPLRGLEVKEPTYAMLKVIDLLGREIRLYDSGSSYGTSTTYTNFILQSVQEPRQEKHQVVETFGDPYIFFYGEQARYLMCTAVLVNSSDFNWQAEFWANYDQYLRGSRCAEAGARIYMFYDDNIVEGYMLEAMAASDSLNPMAVQLQFRIFVTNYRNISLIGDPRYPIRTGVSVEFEGPTTPGTTAVKKLPSASQFGAAKSLAAKDALDNTPKLRGLIHDNWDEWTGKQPTETPPEDPQEIEDLIAAAVDEAAANAANMNNVDTIVDSSVDKAQQGGGGGTPVRQGTSPTSYSVYDQYGCDPAGIPYQVGEQCFCQLTGGGETEVPCWQARNSLPEPSPDPSQTAQELIDQQNQIAQQAQQNSSAANSQSAVPGSSEGEHRAR